MDGVGVLAGDASFERPLDVGQEWMQCSCEGFCVRLSFRKERIVAGDHDVVEELPRRGVDRLSRFCGGPYAQGLCSVALRDERDDDTTLALSVCDLDRACSSGKHDT